jgi:DNA (cytosine-5)-methyltransferase 1
MNPNSKKIEAIDLFCGVGGLTHGLSKAEISVLAGLDSDLSCKYAYEKNNNSKFINADISKFDFLTLKKMYSKNSIKVLSQKPL